MLVLPDAATLRGWQASSAGQRKRWQNHHLVPLSISRRPQLGRFLRELGRPGAAVQHLGANSLWLPGDEALAAEVGMCMHRGPHPHYNDVVAARVERIRVANLDQAASVLRLARLQRALIRVLSGRTKPILRLNRNDPMRLFADYAVLDAAIETLIGLPPGAS